MPTDPIITVSLNLEAAERAIVTEAIRLAHGHIIDAAALCGITRHALKRRVVRFGLQKELKDARSPSAQTPESAAPS